MSRKRLTKDEKIEWVGRYLESKKSQREFHAAHMTDVVSLRNFEKWCSKYRDHVNYGIDEDQRLKGTSTLYDGEGNVRLQWVKTNKELDDAQKIMAEAAEALKEEITPEDPSDAPDYTESDLMSLYPVTDYHLGQLSWREETGADWDLDIAQDMLVKWFSAAIKSAPHSEVGVLANLGDFLHWDGLEALTPTSGHTLEGDTRFQKIVNTAVVVLRQCINMMLQKHNKVHVIMAEGNHDLASSVWLRALFAEKYQNEPRVTVDNSHVPFYCYEWGDTSLFFHHGHKVKINHIAQLMAGHFREVYGRTKYSYAHVAHLHHADVKENNMMIVRQHPTLAAPDAHTSRSGYRAQRGASVITYSKKYGATGEIAITPEMVK